MKPSRLVVGLHDAPAVHCDRPTLARLRDLSLSWLRFGYQGPVIEGPDAGPILERALERGYEYCLLLASGTICDENWCPAHWGRQDVHRALGKLMDHCDFLAAGRIIEDSNGAFKIDDRCVLVDLNRYVSCGRLVPAGAALTAIVGARPGGARGPCTSSWMLRDASNGSIATFRAFDPSIASAIVDLVSPRGDAACVSPYFGRQIQEFPANDSSDSVSRPALEERLLAKIRRQTSGARRGVFPFNYESYDDIELPPPGFESPLKSLYCVAAGLKPYRIIKTHGYDCDTRVVLFDYSVRALDFRQRLLEEWDGADYPSYLRKAFAEMPPPDTYFWLWADLSPDQVDMRDLEALWRSETDRWGGAEAFQEHWTKCRSLSHEFVLCDLVDDPQLLLEQVRSEPGAVIWWSNAFFTIYSNWFFTLAERRQRYLRFINGLAETAPCLFLYGADHMNSSVNSVRAEDYASLLEREAGDGLMPARIHRLQIRS
jgi:hypothetical protein